MGVQGGEIEGEPLLALEGRDAAEMAFDLLKGEFLEVIRVQAADMFLDEAGREAAGVGQEGRALFGGGEVGRQGDSRENPMEGENRKFRGLP